MQIAYGIQVAEWEIFTKNINMSWCICKFVGIELCEDKIPFFENSTALARLLTNCAFISQRSHFNEF